MCLFPFCARCLVDEKSAAALSSRALAPSSSPCPFWRALGSDSEGIRTPAGRAQWTSSPSPWPLGHTVSDKPLEEGPSPLAFETDESCGGGIDVCKEHRAPAWPWGRRSERHHPRHGAEGAQEDVPRSCCACSGVCVAATARGFEPLRPEPNGFLVHHLGHSVTLSLEFLGRRLKLGGPW